MTVTGTSGLNNLKILDGPLDLSLYAHSLLRIKMWRYLIECLSTFLFILMHKSPGSSPVLSCKQHVLSSVISQLPAVINPPEKFDF